jgi:hypothetical protein
VDDRDADDSACGHYRYRLRRRWDPDKPTALFVMLHPSTADPNADDRTIQQCLAYTRRWHAGAIDVYNLYAGRTSTHETYDTPAPQ